jgi:hypothetical protein
MGGRGIRSGWWRALRAAAVATLALGTVIAGLTAPSTAAPATWTPDASHPYSDPVWFPLRSPATVSCTYRNCAGPYHAYWALDLVGDLGDPVYAAGAGILHVGARDTTCRSALSSTESEGTWVWIDHGGGVTSRYRHLDTLSVPDGALVTPHTQIGRMGHSGDVAPCQTNYLHFEVRGNGPKGPRVNPGQLVACVNGRATELPRVWGYSSWASIAKGTRRTPASDNSCLPSSAQTPSATRNTSVQSGDGRATVFWNAPADAGSGVTGYVIYRERWAPSVQRWSTEGYRRVSAGETRVVVTGLTNRRTYRFRVFAESVGGFGRSGQPDTVIPAAPPPAPRVARWLTSGSDYVRFAWWKPVHRGAPVSAYRVRIRQLTLSGWTAFRVTKVSASTFHYRWLRLRPKRTYQVQVQALSAAGASPWSSVRRISTAA